MELPPEHNSFRRLLAYRIAQRFGLTHAVSDQINEVKCDAISLSGPIILLIATFISFFSFETLIVFSNHGAELFTTVFVRHSCKIYFH